MIVRYGIIAIGVVAAIASSESLASAKTQLVVVIGAAGEPQYGKQFQDSAGRWSELAVRADAEITTIGLAAPATSSDREQLRQRLTEIAASEASSLWLVMIGHGTFLKGDAKFNLRGPDVSANDLNQWLDAISIPTVIINGTSASGPFVNALAKQNRIVLTATKSGTEDNYARFSEYFAHAIDNPAADLDHDDEVSLLEAFLLASNQTQSFYANEGRISTEHALLDDNGDGLGTPSTMFDGVYAKSPKDSTKQADGAIAAGTILIPSEEPLELTPEELAQRSKIEAQLNQLRSERESLSDDEFDKRLESLLRPLSKIYYEAMQRADS